MGLIRCCVAVYLVSLLLATLCRAGFVDGVEGFDGTSKEPTIWEEYHATNQGFAAQSNSMLLASPASGSGIEYTTTLAQVGIGGSVRVEVSEASLHPGGSYAALILTTNSRGTTQQFSFDDHWLEFDYFEGTGFGSWYGGDGSGAGTIESGTYTSTPGELVKLQITRLSATTAAFSAFAADDTLLVTRTHTFSGTPSSLNVALFAYNLDATFDNVTLSGNYVVPEPTLLAPSPPSPRSTGDRPAGGAASAMALISTHLTIAAEGAGHRTPVTATADNRLITSRTPTPVTAFRP